ncbi:MULTISPECIES: alpha/beta hydrolase [unclassified Sinorhizobium]|uniref:alpha/beta fold hydrolase n=1 Tax=unclassified Sinorhizobium TaxID=2613772 RepID=UPI0024C226CF|nr:MULTISPECIES: alpha/beta hydrolase [unclassified Sinorhizobium]MDK1374752.1 alpha/beta hydrolase [Sinorhizobium sp. 6-70]MDK1479065.1 alpha/beta hydrolase [Sinorhizobium sp. 6-117]
MHSQRQEIRTSHGIMAVEMTAGDGPDVVFIHGNSSSRQVFHRQVSNKTFKNYRLISFDLPGHGESSDALEKTRTYPLPGLAEATIELLEHVVANSPVLVGWSLGGHVAMEMLAQSYAASGLFITGAPPVGPVIAEGFRGNLMSGLASRGRMSAEDAAAFVQSVFGASAEPFMERAAARTDHEFRSTLFSAHRLDEKSNQRDIVSDTTVKTAVVNGRDDRVVNLDYVDGVPFSRLWRETCFRIPDAGHAPFLQAPIAFNALLSAFLADVAWDAAL